MCYTLMRHGADPDVTDTVRGLSEVIQTILYSSPSVWDTAASS